MLTAKVFNSGSFVKAGSFDNGVKAKQKKESIRRVPLKISDEHILEMRFLYEFEGWSTKRIQEKFAEHSMSHQKLYQILQYYTRLKLIPKRLAA